VKLTGKEQDMETTRFNITWQIESGPLLAAHPELNMNLLRRLYFDSAAQQWGHVVSGWPKGTFLEPPRGGGAPPSLLIKVVFKDLVRSDEVARVDPAELLSHLVSGPDGKEFPSQGTISIDLPDVKRLLDDQPRFKDTIVHEVGHVLGLGTLFQQAGLVSKDGKKYVGDYGRKAYSELLGLKPGSVEDVPLQKVEDGKSTPAFHWDERALEKDVMSTLLDQPGVAGSSKLHPDDSPADRINVISIVSAGALKDLGYVVDSSKAMRTRAERVPSPEQPLATSA
jgi:hypothetical protein